MTAYDTSELSEKLQQLKVKEVITKPVNPEEIRTLVAQCAGSRSSHNGH